MFETGFRLLEGRRKIEDRPTVLDRYDAPHRKAAAVACPVDLVDDRRVHVAPAQEVGVQRMGYPFLHGVLSCGERLSEYLATEDLGTADIATVTAEYVVLDPLQPEQSDQVIEYRVHADCGQTSVRPPSTAML